MLKFRSLRCLLPFAIRPSTTICLLKTKIPCALVRYRLYRKCSRITFGWNSANHDKTQAKRKAQRASHHHRKNSKHDQFWWVLLRVALGQTTPSTIFRSSVTLTTCYAGTVIRNTCSSPCWHSCSIQKLYCLNQVRWHCSRKPSGSSHRI